MQTRLDEKEGAERRATKSETEAAELSKRLVELKMGEIERMNEACKFLLLCFFCTQKQAQLNFLHSLAEAHTLQSY